MNKGIIFSSIESPFPSGKIDDCFSSVLDNSDIEVLKNYPVVYIHYWKKPDENGYDMYVGESNDIVQRTREHLHEASNNSNWQSQLLNKEYQPFFLILGHNHFNKSLTLDIENRLIQYISSMDTVNKLYNGRGNPQNKYYPDSEMDDLFNKAWIKLKRHNKDVFLPESKIKDSAIFKASPFHKLTAEQINAQNIIIDRIQKALEDNSKGQLILVEGEAGTGKTVLINSTFFNLIESNEHINCYLLVNHNEQLSVYREIARKLNVPHYEKIVNKPTSFINEHSEENPVDVVFVDEAHLLWTQGKQSYRGNNQLNDLIKRAKVTVIMFDEHQILTTEQYLESDEINDIRDRTKKNDKYVKIENQLRMKCGAEVMEWIDSITNKHLVKPLGKKTTDYELKICQSPNELRSIIKRKAENEESKLSRIIATYDWMYSSKHSPETGDYWEVKIEGTDFHMPWNREIYRRMGRNDRRKNNKLAWAEQEHTIDEVGSTFTIQGFDLVYSGVIIGPSVKYRNGKLEFDPQSSKNEKATRNRTLKNGKKEQFGEELLSHELRILLTRGVKGMYIYACDDELRDALTKSIEDEQSII